MPEEIPPTYSQLVRKLPYRLQSRFTSFGNYVNGILDEYTKNEGVKLSKKDRDLIKLIAFTFALEDFFKQGTLVTKQAIRVFEDLGEKGFTVGRTEFTRDNENTLKGEILSDRLNSLIVENNQMSKFQDETSLKSKIFKIIRSVSHNKRMDRSNKNT